MSIFGDLMFSVREHINDDLDMAIASGQIESLNKDNMSALLREAVAAGNGPAVVVLLNKGADPNGRDDIGCTAMHYASKPKQKEIIALLQQGGADLDAQNNEGLTALHVYTMSMWDEGIHAMVNYGANVNLLTRSNASVLSFAVRLDVQLSDKVIEAILRAGADANIKETNGMNAFKHAISKDNEMALTTLLTHVKPDASFHMLHYAVESRAHKVCRRLLEFGMCNVNDRDANGDTPLHIACKLPKERYQDGLVAMLIQAGADSDARNSAGKRPADYFKSLWHEKHVKSFEDTVRNYIAERIDSEALPEKDSVSRRRSGRSI